MSLITYNEALERISRLSLAFGTERVPLADAHGRTLAEDLEANVDSPPFTNSAMDGFAFKHHDAAHHAKLTILGTLYARAIEPNDIPAHKSDGCVRIMTGAMMPEWADTVVPVEHATVEGNDVTFGKLPEKGANVRERGTDIIAGTLLLKAGAKLDPERVMVAAAFGHAELPVRQQLRAVLLSTGDELVEPGQALKPGAIYNSSQYFLAAAIAQEGLPLHKRATIPDDAANAAKEIEAVLKDGKPTLIVTTGAVSAGERDFIPQLGQRLGFEASFHKVAIRPGKPIYLAKLANTVWVGLPGNAISTCVGWHYFARPLIAHLLGRPAPQKKKLVLMTEVKKPADLRCFFRAEVNSGKVWVARQQGSAQLAASITQEAYVELPEGLSVLPANSPVDALIV
jgi:molybdopterin molybdotransferase